MNNQVLLQLFGVVIPFTLIYLQKIPLDLINITLENLYYDQRELTSFKL